MPSRRRLWFSDRESEWALSQRTIFQAMPLPSSLRVLSGSTGIFVSKKRIVRLPVKRAMEVCPVEVAVSVLGGTWKLTLVKHLMEGTHRFGELSRLMPSANRKTLIRQIRELEEDGIVSQEVYAEVPPKVEYSLTELGQSLAPLIDQVNHWGAIYSQHVVTAEPSS